MSPLQNGGTNKKWKTSKAPIPQKIGQKQEDIFLGHRNKKLRLHKKEDRWKENRPVDTKETEYITDTNVLLANADVLFSFEERDVVIPFIVLTELDGLKKSYGGIGMQARATIDNLLRLVESVAMSEIAKGIPLLREGEKLQKGEKRGKLFFEIPSEETIEDMLDKEKPDHALLLYAMRRRKDLASKKNSILLSRDKLLRITAAIIGVSAEEHYDEASAEEVIVSQGIHHFENAFWEKEKQELHEQNSSTPGYSRKSIRTFISPSLKPVHINEFMTIKSDGVKKPTFRFQVLEKPSPHVARIREITDYTKDDNRVFGLNAENEGQNFALNLLMDPKIQVVVIEGLVGSGKDILALAAAYEQMFTDGLYSEIIATRVPLPIGKDPGTFPGNPHQKTRDWMGGITTNARILYKLKANELFPLETRPVPRDWLTETNPRKDTKKDVKKGRLTNEQMQERLRIWMLQMSLNYIPLSIIRGWSFYDEYVILDEAQNCTPEAIKSFLTRLGGKAKMVLLGSFTQSDQYPSYNMELPFAKVIESTVGLSNAARIVLTETVRHELVRHYANTL